MKSTPDLLYQKHALVPPQKAVAAGKSARDALTSFLDLIDALRPYNHHTYDWMEQQLVSIAEVYGWGKVKHERSDWKSIRDEVIAVHSLAQKLENSLNNLSSRVITELARSKIIPTEYGWSYNIEALKKELSDLLLRSQNIAYPTEEYLEIRPFQQVQKGPRFKLYITEAVDELCNLSSIILGKQFGKTLAVSKPRDQNFIEDNPNFVLHALVAIDPNISFATVRSKLQQRGQAQK